MYSRACWDVSVGSTDAATAAMAMSTRPILAIAAFS